MEVPEPQPSHMLTPGSGVLVDVHAAGVSFPELLLDLGREAMAVGVVQTDLERLQAAQHR